MNTFGVLNLLIATLFLFGCGGGSTPSYIKNIPLSGWQVSFSKGVGQDGVTLDVPQVPVGKDCSNRNCPSLNYFWKKVNGKIKPGSGLYIDFVIKAPSATWNYKLEPNNNCPSPARVSFIIQHEDDDMQRANGRFWAKSRVVLNHGTHLLYAKMDRKNFINVYGKTPTDSAWKSMLNNPGRVGVTFGGGCFYGHGVNVSGGTATFQLKRFTF